MEISIDEASAKVRTGGPNDDAEDYELDIWAGEIPLKTQAMPPIADEKLKAGLKVPKSVLDYLKAGK